MHGIVGTVRGAREGSRHRCAKARVATLLNRAQPRGDLWGPQGAWPGVAYVSASKLAFVCPLLQLPLMGQAHSWPQLPGQSMAGSPGEAASPRWKV